MTDEQAVLSRYQAMQQAMCDKDMAALNEIVLDGTTFTHMSGRVQTKEEYLGDIERGRLDYRRFRIDDPSVSVDKDNAVLTATVTLTANAYGAYGSWSFKIKAHLVKTNGIWYYTN